MNRLSGEKSPYLLQHAENPVDWYPWGPEALTRALEEDKPILVSIGYSACHWCHVMEREAFEDADIASFMNLHFVNIKVDREERPDVDAIYMEAVQALTGQGGWPLNAFLTSDASPFYGGTYFPPHPAHGLPSWRQVLESVAGTYRDRRHDVMHNAASLTDYVRRSQLLQDDSADVHVDLLRGALDSIQYQFDRNNGGFGGAPKFPQPLALELSLRLWKRFGADEILKFVCLSLDRMLAGGIFDQLGGGFHRYSVDAMWVVPHFEKMLYDNALLARAYLHGFQITGNADYRDVCERTLCYMIRELCSPEGAFYSAQDADSEGIEGRFYVWSPAELRHVLTHDERQVTSLRFGISEEGNFEGATILTRSLTPADVAERLRKSEEEVRRLLESSCDKLLAARSHRVPPATDTKILASWNALAITTLAEAGRVLQRSDFVTSARRAADFVLQHMWTDRRLVRSYRGGPSSVHAFLEDYANLIDALLSLYEACSDSRYLDAAGALAVVTVEHFWDEEKSIFFDASADSLDVVVRPRSLFDNPVPSGTASTSMALSRLGALTGDTRYERFVRATFESVAGLVQRAPVGFPALLSALDFYLSAQTQIAVAGDRDEEETTRLISVVNSTYLPNAVLSVGPEDSSPLLKGRRRQGDAPTAYVCHQMACRLPTRDPVTLQALIEEAAGV